MMPKKVLYTDGHEVTVTDSSFQVKKTLYMLSGITKHGFTIIHPDRLPAFLVLLIGSMLITLGALNMIPQRTVPDIQFLSFDWTANTLAIGVGIVIAVMGIVGMILMHDRYAVRIATAEGEKNVLVSSRREYIEQIIDALNKAFIDFVSPPHTIKIVKTSGR
jgi:hypothetical protein